MSSSPERIRTLTDNQPPGSQDGRKRFTPDDPFGDLFSDETAKTADANEGSPRRSGGSRRRESAAAKQGKRSLLVVLVLVVVVAVSAAVVWFGFGSQLRSLFGGGASSADFEGSGNGTEMAFTIESGDTGTSIGERLAEVGIVKTSGAFVDEVLAQPEDPVFIPGSYGMQEEMSAESALASLLDPENRQESTVVIPEGTALQDVYALIEGGIGIPVAELEAAAIPANFGLPAEATTLEGFLFPATYSFDPGVDATTVLKTLVDRMFQSLDEHGVAPEARWDTIRLASLIQKEAGLREDYYKVSRVFLNRLDMGMLLQSDATVAYGTGNTHRVSTSDAERADAANVYNTYVHPGMVAGPISNPGDIAIDAAVNPADGPWVYFVTWNLDTGETIFSETFEEHEVAVAKWLAWMADHPEYG